MFTLPNCISLMRFPLAFLFLQQNTSFRCFILILAGISDICDGYIARKYDLKSTLGTVLDPLMDKFFVVFVLGVLLQENYLTWPEAVTMLSRDFAVLLFGCYLLISNGFKSYKCHAIWCGKATTFLQLGVLLALVLQYTIPVFIFGIFIVLGLLALGELYLTRELNSRKLLP